MSEEINSMNDLFIFSKLYKVRFSDESESLIPLNLILGPFL
jgi:hypothetical protein